MELHSCEANQIDCSLSRGFTITLLRSLTRSPLAHLRFAKANISWDTCGVISVVDVSVMALQNVGEGLLIGECPWIILVVNFDLRGRAFGSLT